MLDKLNSVEAKYNELLALLGDGNVQADQSQYRTHAKALAREFPAMAPLRPSIAVAVNAEYAKFEATVADGDEIAFLPPVSGG